MAPKRRVSASITDLFAKKPRTSPAKQNPPDISAVPPPSTDTEQFKAAGLVWSRSNGVSWVAEVCIIGDFVRADPPERPPNLYPIKQLSVNLELLRQVLRAYARQGHANHG
ncbi:hypothetical protein PC116_g24246 [Phytophthora cactorum]|uniref:Uncharacterized protein n=1 Tax=Phytophthora cactorum TaxID=29920 RepID=A0A8T1B2R9_9STRA|nr:hypothetical protein PC111_g21025 [Phytophthora cactorum]KAG2833612.1 hypothetical protein PC112_g6390 [Phytophthora cactorum]KAG2835986.1 hypothetical protein PC113_g20119 [Phytophthora cactorum]KAG2893807.1 hypothetical protein PC117_g23671 [Phytophthora cactorum]KAG2962702.1 hypothetical protein PC118_g21289 [Phytophthora cactorum]